MDKTRLCCTNMIGLQVHEQKMAAEVAAAKKERDFYLQQVSCLLKSSSSTQGLQGLQG